MSNSLGVMSGNLIASRALQILLAEYGFLARITSDFSNEAALFNQDLKIALPSSMSAVSWDPADGYEAASVTQTEATLSLDNHVHCTYSFDDQEVNSTSAPLLERFSRAAAHGVAKSIMDAIAALIINANYSNKTVRSTSQLLYMDCVAMAKALSARNVPTTDRWLILNGDSYAHLLSDSALVANSGSPSSAIRTGGLGLVCGLDTFEYPAMPSNSENLIGFGGGSEAILLACRIPAIPAGVQPPGLIETVTEPSSK